MNISCLNDWDSPEIWLRCSIPYITNIRDCLTPTNHAGYGKTYSWILMRFLMSSGSQSEFGEDNIFQFSIFLSRTFYQVEVILHSPKLEQKGLDRRYWKSQEEIKQGKMFLWYQVNNLTTNQASLSQPTAVPVIKVMSKENPQHFIASKHVPESLVYRRKC